LGGWWNTNGNDMATVIEIVKAHLVANGFDGLVQTDAECGCLCDELAPCGGDFSSCEPAYRGANIDQTYSPDDWAMYLTKERARESVETVKARNYERPGMRRCEFCGCKTNAALRACCHSGNEADRSKAADNSAPNCA
jgi:hypothetical protein